MSAAELAKALADFIKATPEPAEPEAKAFRAGELAALETLERGLKEKINA